MKMELTQKEAMIILTKREMDKPENQGAVKRVTAIFLMLSLMGIVLAFTGAVNIWLCLAILLVAAAWGVIGSLQVNRKVQRKIREQQLHD